MMLAIKGRLYITPLVTNAKLPFRLVKAVTRPAANMVVDTGLEVIRALLGGFRGNPPIGGVPYPESAFTSMFVSKLSVASHSGTPPAPQPSDTGHSAGATVEWEFLDDISTLTMSYTATSVVFSGVIPKPDLGGVRLQEACLFTGDDTLVSRLVFDKTKTTAFALQFDHEIEITRV